VASVVRLCPFVRRDGPCGAGRPHGIGCAALAQTGHRTALRAGTAAVRGGESSDPTSLA